MTTIKHKRISNGWLIFGLLLGAAGLAAGTFADLPLDQMVYDPYRVWARILAAVAPAPVFWGLGAAGFLTLDVLREKKTMFLGWIFAFLTNIVGPVYLYDSIVEELGLTWWFAWLAGLLISILPALLYWFLMRKAERKDKIKCIWILLIVCGGSLVAVQLLKRLWMRPRYITLLGNTEVPFRAWYEFGKEGVAQFSALYESNHDLFRSFPSGHAQGITCLFVWALIPCFTKKGSVTLAMLIAFTGTIATMASRLVMGAHFISDVSAGFLITFILFCLCCWAFRLTRHDDSYYEYDDEDEFEDRTVNKKASRKNKNKNAEPETVEIEEDIYDFPVEAPAAHQKLSRSARSSSEKHADNEIFIDDNELATERILEEEDAQTAELFSEDNPVITEEIRARASEQPKKRIRKKRSERTAADLFDDSIFD